MTPQELKNSILQLAVQGRLVEQRPEEGTAEILLTEISTHYMFDGQRVKEKNITEIADEEKLFDIPDTWKWIKLGSVCVIARGGSPRPIKEYITTASDGINWIKIGDTEKNGKYISSTAEKIKPSGVSKSRMVHAGDFLLTNSMSFGRPYILKVDGCIHDGWLVISQSKEVFDQDFLYWLLSSYYAYIQFSEKVSGAVVKNLNSDKVANSVFPLPPLAEQKRIVAKIEELLPLIDRYEEAWTKLEAFNKRFPADMQKSLLQMAIQGKLVEQRPEEGTAEELYQQIQSEKQSLIKSGKIKKEKPLPEITEEEKPFDIPDSWMWVRLSTLFRLINGDRGKNYPSKDKLSENGEIPFISAINMDNQTVKKEGLLFVSKAQYDALGGGKLQKNDFVFCLRGSLGKFCQYPFEIGAIASSLVILRKYGKVYDEYIKVYLSSTLISEQIHESNNGTAQPNLGARDIAKYIIPLPPLAEQKRIVAKLEQLLPLCDKLK